MPKPHGTYIRIKQGEKLADVANRNKRLELNQPSTQDIERLYRHLGDIETWHRRLAAQVDEKSSNLSERTHQDLGKLVKQLAKFLEKGEVIKQLGIPKAHVKPIISAPNPLGPADITPALLIALLHVLAVFIQMMKKSDSD